MACQTPSIPRKGTETHLLKRFRIVIAWVRHPQFPARGRKRGHPQWTATHPRLRQTPSIPRKGTETILAVLEAHQLP